MKVTGFKILMVGTWIIGATGLPTEDVGMWAQWGLAGLVVGFVLWDSHKREIRQDELQKENQDWIKTQFIDTMERNTKAFNQILDATQGCDSKKDKKP